MNKTHASSIIYNRKQVEQVSISQLHAKTYGVNSTRYKPTVFWNIIVGKLPDIDSARKTK